MNDYAFGNFLAALRQEKGMTQKELGALMGVSDKAVSKWEMGAAKPRTDTLVKLSELFSVSMEEWTAGKRLTPSDEKPSSSQEKDTDGQIARYQAETRYEARRIFGFSVGIVLLFALLILLVEVSEYHPMVDETIGPVLSLFLLLGLLVLLISIGVAIARLIHCEHTFRKTFPAAVAKLRTERIMQQRPLTKTAWVLLIIGSVTFTLSIIVSFWEPLYGLSLVFRLTWFVLLAIVALKHFPWK